MVTESRLALLAAAAREVDAVPIRIKPKFARNGAHLRLRVPSREQAERLDRTATSLGFYTGGVLREGAVSCQLVVVVPAKDLVELRRMVGDGSGALPATVGELTS